MGLSCGLAGWAIAPKDGRWDKRVTQWITVESHWICRTRTTRARVVALALGGKRLLRLRRMRQLR